MFSCKKDEPKEAEPEKKPAATSPAAKPAAEPVQEAKKEDDPGLRRNPFLSHIVLEAGVKKEKKVKGPLECCDAGSFKVIAVVTGLEKSSALVLAPDMKRYIVREGDILGTRGGRIVKIDGKGVTIRERLLDEDGKTASINDVELMMPSDKSGETLK